MYLLQKIFHRWLNIHEYWVLVNFQGRGWACLKSGSQIFTIFVFLDPVASLSNTPQLPEINHTNWPLSITQKKSIRSYWNYRECRDSPLIGVAEEACKINNCVHLLNLLSGLQWAELLPSFTSHLSGVGPTSWASTWFEFVDWNCLNTCKN